MERKTFLAIIFPLVFMILMSVSFKVVGQNQTSEVVTKVIDGDTLAIDAKWSPYGLSWKVRVRGIDTPEQGTRAKCSVEKNRAARAKALVQQAIASSNSRIRLQNVEHDKYGGRIVADVYLSDGSSLADRLLAAKLAKRYNGSGPKPVWCY